MKSPWNGVSICACIKSAVGYAVLGTSNIFSVSLRLGVRVHAWHMRRVVDITLSIPVLQYTRMSWSEYTAHLSAIIDTFFRQIWSRSRHRCSYVPRGAGCCPGLTGFLELIEGTNAAPIHNSRGINQSTSGASVHPTLQPQHLIPSAHIDKQMPSHVRVDPPDGQMLPVSRSEKNTQTSTYYGLGKGLRPEFCTYAVPFRSMVC